MTTIEPTRILTVERPGVVGIVDRYTDTAWFWEAFRVGHGPSYGRLVGTKEEAEAAMRATVARLQEAA